MSPRTGADVGAVISEPGKLLAVLGQVQAPPPGTIANLMQERAPMKGPGDREINSVLNNN